MAGKKAKPQKGRYYDRHMRGYFCSNCDNAVGDDYNFCPICGQDLFEEKVKKA